MNKTWIIIQREFSVRVKKKSFILLTILMPFLIAALVFVPALLSQLSSSDGNKVAVIDTTGQYAPLFSSDDRITFDIVSLTGTFEEMSKEYRDESSPYDAVVYITSDLTHSKDGATIYSRKEVPVEVESRVNHLLSEQIRKDRLSHYAIDNIDEIIQEADVDFSSKTVKWDKDGGEKVSSSVIAGVVGMIMALFIYMFIMAYGGMVMQSVMEEKTNRIVEIMVSSVRPQQLMFGKMIGIALVGFAQFFIWLLMITSILAIAGSVYGISTMGAAPAMSGTMPAELPDNAMAEALQIFSSMNLPMLVVLFILYFIGGYLLFSSLFAAIGASINEQQDAQQFMMPITLIFVFGLYAGMFSIQNPDGPLALWCSFIPLTSPIVMMIRLPFDIPWWHIVLSLLFLYGTTAALVWLSAKIYRVGILMYGKKPTFKDMAKWLRYK